MKIPLLMFVIGFAVVISRPNVSDRWELPCGGNVTNVANCTCVDLTVVYPSGDSCHALNTTIASCVCIDDD